MMQRMTFARILLMFVVVSGGCGGGGAAPSDAAAIMDAGASPDGTLPACPALDAGEVQGVACLRAVEANVVDERGAPLGGILASVCGTECWFGTSDVAGRLVVPVGARLRPDEYSLVLHGRPARAGYYVHLPAIENSVARYARPLRLVDLPADGPPVDTNRAAQTLASGDVTLTVPAGVEVLPNVEDVGEGPIPFRARLVEGALAPAFLDGLSPAPDALYAIAPYEALLDGAGARLAITNRLGLPAGAAVELLGLGSLLDATGPPPGALAAIGLAHVSPDGKRIEPDAPIHFLTWFALRKKGN